MQKSYICVVYIIGGTLGILDASSSAVSICHGVAEMDQADGCRKRGEAIRWESIMRPVASTMRKASSRKELSFMTEVLGMKMLKLGQKVFAETQVNGDRGMEYPVWVL